MSDSSGNPVSNLRIYGLSKPLGSSSTNYVWSETYHHTWAHPDDILVENWGTTDVYPGTYHLEAKNTDGTLYQDLGWHTVAAGKITYVGLYPVYLPDVRDSEGWTASIVVRNNSEADTARVVTTYFWSSGAVYTQTTHPVSPRAALTLDPPGNSFTGSAVTVASEDVSVVVRNQRSGEITIYNGVRAAGGSPGWEQVGSTLYAPVIKNNWSGRSSRIRVLNTGAVATTVSVKYYRYDTGQQQGDPVTLTLAPNARGAFDASGCDPGYYCSAVIASSNGQPLAAVVRESAADGSASATYNASSAASATHYAPLVKKNYNLQSTGISVMNTAAANANVTVTYYDADGSGSYTAPTVYDLPPQAVTVFYNPAGLTYALSSAVIQTTQLAAVLVHESGSGFYKASNGFLGGSGEAYVPEVFNTTIKGGITVQNMHSSQTERVRVHYYDTDGTLNTSTAWQSISPGRAYSFHSWNGGIPSDFHGSARVESENGRAIGVIVNESRSGSGDTHATYNGSQP